MSNTDLTPGTIVRHPKRGLGVVCDISRFGTATTYHIAFEDGRPNKWTDAVDDLTVIPIPGPDEKIVPAGAVVVELGPTGHDSWRSLAAELRMALFRSLAAQIEAQAKPPIPDEPSDPAVRVKDRDGDVWARIGGAWVTTDVSTYTWTEMIAKFGPVEVIQP